MSAGLTPRPEPRGRRTRSVFVEIHLKTSKRILSAVAAVFLVSAGIAQAAPTAWSQPAGSAPDFNYSNGRNTNAKFGDPIVGGDTFLFFPSSLVADSTNGVAASDSDTASFVASAHSGKRLSKVTVGLQGDYSINDGSGITTLAVGGTAEVVGTLKITNTATNQVLMKDVTFTPGQPVSGNGGVNNGAFDGAATVNLPGNWSDALVELTALIHAGSALGGTSLIQVKGASVEVSAAAVPLPPALLAAPAAMAIGAIARRRMKKA